MQILIAGLLCIASTVQVQGEDSRTARANELVADFEGKVAQLGANYLKSLKVMDKEFFDQTELFLKELIESLEQSRKWAMERDQLDRAVKYRSLIEKYSQWLNEDMPTDTEDSDASSAAGRKESAEIIFARKLSQANRDRKLKERKLVETLQKTANSLRQNVLEALDKIRTEAMQEDDLEDALLIRGQFEAIKSLDLSQPQFVEEIEEPAKPETALGNTELLIAVQPVSDKTVQQSVEIPSDAKKIEVSFYSDWTSENYRYKHPGYDGTLRINGKLIVSYVRKYKWRDGKHYHISLAFDGSEVNSRFPDSLQGSYDVTDLVVPGSQAVFSYRNGQRTAVGV